MDINPNSVKICRLRLWIELLKNAYYKNGTELETLPNIDINIKCGNSLVSRFSIDSDLSEALKKSKDSLVKDTTLLSDVSPDITIGDLKELFINAMCKQFSEVEDIRDLEDWQVNDVKREYYKTWLNQYNINLN